jgi:3'-5' exonuclease
MLLDLEKIKNMLFFDMETVAEYSSYNLLPDNQKALWDKVSKRYLGADYENASLEAKSLCYMTNAGLYPEFSKVVSISYGVVNVETYAPELRIIVNPDEATMLSMFMKVLNVAFERNINRILAGHNIAGFDIPFLIKRMIKHNLVVPTLLLRIVEAKPWDQPVYDTIRTWKFGGTEFVSLDCICTFLGIDTPKTGMVTGSSLNTYYYNIDIPQEEKLQNIANYNKADVLAVIQVVLRLAKH